MRSPAVDDAAHSINGKIQQGVHQVKRVTMSGFRCGGWILAALHFAACVAGAQSVNRALDEDVTLRIGPLWADADATIKTPGEDSNLTEKLSADEVDFSFFALWRINPKWRVEASYSGIESTGSDTLDTDVDTGIGTIPAGLKLNGSFETELVRVAVGYVFSRTESYEAGVDFGINYTTVKTSLGATVPGLPTVDLASFDISEPLPTIGLFFNYGFTPKWYLNSRAGVFAFDIGDIDGTIFEFGGGIEYRPWEPAGLGLGYFFNSADVTLSGSGQKTDVEWEYHGPLLYVVFGF